MNWVESRRQSDAERQTARDEYHDSIERLEAERDETIRLATERANEVLRIRRREVFERYIGKRDASIEGHRQRVLEGGLRP